MIPLYDIRGRHVADLFDDEDPLFLLENLCRDTPHSVYDASQQFMGSINVNHTWIPCAPTQVGEWAISWDEDVAERVIVGEIVWDGASHLQITGWWESKEVGGPRCRTMPWPSTGENESSDGALPQ